MPVARSALQSLAASVALATSAPTFGASSAAIISSRSTRSRTVPSLAWKVTPSSFFSRASSGTFLSSLQKKRASDSLADSTRAFPAAMVVPPSGASMLATVRKCAASLSVLASRTAKYFW